MALPDGREPRLRAVGGRARYRRREPGARPGRRTAGRAGRAGDSRGVRAVRAVLVRRVPDPLDAARGVQPQDDDGRRREHRSRPGGRQGLRVRAAPHRQLGRRRALVRRERLPDRGGRRRAEAPAPVRAVPASPRGARHEDRRTHQGRSCWPAAQAAAVRELDDRPGSRPGPHRPGHRRGDVRGAPARPRGPGPPRAQLRRAPAGVFDVHAPRWLGGPDRRAARDRAHRPDARRRVDAVALDGRAVRARDRGQADRLAHVPAGVGRDRCRRARRAGGLGRPAMRVLLVCPYDWAAPGGVQVHVRQLADALGVRAHQTLIVAPGTEPSPNGHVRIVGRPVRVPYKGTVAPISFSPSSWRGVRAALEAFGPDVVHVHEPFTPSTSMLAVLAATGPVVATFHAFLDRSRLMEVSAPILRQIDHRIDAAVAVSEAAASFVRRVRRGPLEIVPNGVDVARFAEPAEPPEGLPPGPRILWVNRLDPQKGFGVMVQAFDLLSRDVDDVHLLIAGEGRDRAALRSLPRRARNRVIPLGTVPHEEVPRYLAAADVFCSPAVGQESFGIVLVEAMAAGVPVVATDIPGYREVVRDGEDGLLVRPNDPVALAAAIRRVLSEPDLAAALAGAGRARAPAFSWEAVAPRIEAVYDGARTGIR